MAISSYAETLAQVKELDGTNQNTELAILRISEPITSSTDIISSREHSPSKRISDISNDSFDNHSPVVLEADLTHYKELFSKLRFSYLEQVTKEKYLRAIVGDPPLVVGHNDNVELEAELAQVKAELQQRKEEVRTMVDEMEVMGRDLAGRYQKVQLETTQLSELPSSIANLESTVSKLRASVQSSQNNAFDSKNMPSSATPRNLPLDATLRLVGEREAELTTLNLTLSSLETALPRKTREAEAMERELVSLEKRKNEIVAQAKEAQRRKQEGESDGLEELGRWYTGVEQVLKGLV